MKEQILKQVALFASLPPDEVKYLAEILHYREFSPGTVFIEEGEIADHFFILLEGEIEIIKALGTANERVLDVDEAGSFIGEMGLINPGSRRTASVRARTPARLLEMTRADFDALLDRQPGLAVKDGARAQPAPRAVPEPDHSRSPGKEPATDPGLRA